MISSNPISTFGSEKHEEYLNDAELFHGNDETECTANDMEGEEGDKDASHSSSSSSSSSSRERSSSTLQRRLSRDYSLESTSMKNVPSER